MTEIVLLATVDGEINILEAALTTADGRIALRGDALHVQIELGVEETKLVSSNIRAEMGRYGISQEKIAAALKRSQAVVSKRLLGIVPWEVCHLPIVAEVLGVPLSVLLADSKTSVAA